MPYIKKSDRDKISKGRDREFVDDPIMMLRLVIDTEGDLNYTITRICHEYLKNKGEKYSTYNTIIGVLECAKLELYRRKCLPYENLKIAENGDVE